MSSWTIDRGGDSLTIQLRKDSDDRRSWRVRLAERLFGRVECAGYHDLSGEQERIPCRDPISLGHCQCSSSSPTDRDHDWAEEVGDGVDRGRMGLLARREPDGHWVGELEGDTILESEYVLLLAFLGKARRPA